MHFLSLILLLVFFNSSFACEFQDPGSISSTEQNYTTVIRRRSGGVSQPPWKPISIHSEYSNDIRTMFGDSGLKDLKEYVAKATSRLREMLKVQSPGEIKANRTNCKAGKGPETFKNSDFAFFIFPQDCQGGIAMASASACDTERLRAEPATGNVYYSYHSEYTNRELEHFFGRPIAGRIDICIEKFKERKAADAERWISTIMHEMTHALVFSPHNFANFLKRNGNSFQVYDKRQIGFKLTNHGQMIEIPGIVKKVMRDWKTQGGMRKHPVYLVTTPEVTKQAREHFDCPTLEGGELENQGGPGSAMAHWEKRIYEDDTLAAMSSHTSSFSKITLAVFADSGWYQVDYDKADPVAFGWKKGCIFATKSCGEWVETNSADSYPFCKSDDMRCSEDHMQIELCNSFANPTYSHIPWTDEYKYFGMKRTMGQTPKGAPNPFADYCPYYAVFQLRKTGNVLMSKCNTAVSEPTMQEKLSLQMFSNMARCFEIKTLDGGNGLNLKVVEGMTSTSYFTSHGCFEHKCEQGSVWVKTAKGEFNRCSKEGEEVKVKTQIGDGKTVEFTIICPSFKKICEKKEKKVQKNGEETKGHGAKTSKAPTGQNDPEGPNGESSGTSSAAIVSAILSSFVIILLLQINA